MQGLNVVDAGVEDGVVAVGCLYRLQAAVNGGRPLLGNMQPVGTAQSGDVGAIHYGIVENDEAGKVVPIVVPG